MFGLFKKQNNVLPIAEMMKLARNKTKGEYGAAIMYKEQILFQIIKSKFFERYGFNPLIEESFCELHFFNKNKTITKKHHHNFKEDYKANKYFYFENPVGNHTYIKEIGTDLNTIEIISKKRIEEIYGLSLDELEIRVDF
jgi:hypothetical protein